MFILIKDTLSFGDFVRPRDRFNYIRQATVEMFHQGTHTICSGILLTGIISKYFNIDF